MRILVIYNPHAAAGRSRALLPEVRSLLTHAAIDFTVRLTERPGHAAELAERANLSAYDGLVAAGGDGTLFEILNGLYLNRSGARPPLGLIPVGTGNAFARDLGLAPTDWRKAISILAAGRTRALDVGHVRAAGDEFRFLNIIGMGFAVEAGRAAQRLKFLGNAAYTVGTLWRVLRLRHYPLDIEIDGRRFKEDNVFVEISNSRYTGTRFKIAPAAKLDDGLLDLTLLRPLSRLRLLRLFPTIYHGGHVAYEEVHTCQAKHIVIHAPRGMPLSPDGEFRGASPVEIRCLRRDLKLFG